MWLSGPLKPNTCWSMSSCLCKQAAGIDVEPDRAALQPLDKLRLELGVVDRREHLRGNGDGGNAGFDLFELELLLRLDFFDRAVLRAAASTRRESTRRRRPGSAACRPAETESSDLQCPG